MKSGAATVTYHPLAILTSQSLGTKYSVRSANAAACVATYSPDAFFDFNAAMFAKQPAENTSGLSNAQLVSLVNGVDGITSTSRIDKCISDETYASWVADATQRALSGPIPGARISKIASTPTVLANGQQYKYSTPFTVEEFSNFVVTAAGNSYSADPTATATPTPTATGGSAETATAKPTATPTPTASGSPVPGVKKIGTPATR
ncbi:hypothetical protein AX769_06895 [Frondihabitans sp. PAMC 28766]|nr:hypothetical protein AX769_06895 [Frondihabitans sp. PAMC 28766]